MTQSKKPRKSPPLTKTRGKGVRHCCRREDCDKCFRSHQGMAGHMVSAHMRVYTRGEIQHGTVVGYRAEIRRGLQTCEPCRSAWRNAMRAKMVGNRPVRVDTATGTEYHTPREEGGTDGSNDSTV